MQVIMKGKLIPVFVLAALVSCSQPPVKEQGPRPVKLADVTSLNMVEKSFSGVVSPDQFSDLAFKMSGPLISLNVDEGQKGSRSRRKTWRRSISSSRPHPARDRSWPRSIRWTLNGNMRRRKRLSRPLRRNCNVRRSYCPNKLSPSKSMSLRKPLTQMPRRLSSMRKIH